MIVQSLQLKNFRNYESASIQFLKGLNIIVGNNGQGKTNLLESLVYLSMTRSFRCEDDFWLILKNTSFSKIQANIIDSDQKQTLTAIILKDGKSLKINKSLIKKTSEFVGKINIILFSPDDLKIISDSPRYRRALVDREIAKISSKYLNFLNDYRSLLKQRNILLKNQTIDIDYLSTLEERLVKISIPIIKARVAFTKIVNFYLESNYQYLSDSHSKAKIVYQCCINSDVSEENLRKMYIDTREKDILNRSSTCGVQREDFLFMLDNILIKDFASQGQKRIFLLALKLSLLEFVNHVTKKQAILLLDDVFSELDEIRQRKLIEKCKSIEQCFITCTEIPSFLKKEEITIYEVKNGKICGGLA